MNEPAIILDIRRLLSMRSYYPPCREFIRQDIAKLRLLRSADLGRGIDTGEIHYVQGRIDPEWYWPKTPEQKALAKAKLGAFFAASPFKGAQEAAVRMYREIKGETP